MGSLKTALGRVQSSASIRRFEKTGLSLHPASQSFHYKEQRSVPRFPTLLCPLRGDCDCFPTYLLRPLMWRPHVILESVPRDSGRTPVSAESAIDDQVRPRSSHRVPFRSELLNFWQACDCMTQPLCCGTNDPLMCLLLASRTPCTARLWMISLSDVSRYQLTHGAYPIIILS